MKFRMNHNNINVSDMEKSLAFYQEAFGLHVARVHEPEDKSFKLCFLEDDTGGWQLELTWLADHPGQVRPGRKRDPSGPRHRRLRGRPCPTREDGLHLL